VREAAKDPALREVQWEAEWEVVSVGRDPVSLRPSASSGKFRIKPAFESKQQEQTGQVWFNLNRLKTKRFLPNGAWSRSSFVAR
jgi:hypothetical protein